jgi:GNAT superfamily N-acetyltransferase
LRTFCRHEVRALATDGTRDEIGSVSTPVVRAEAQHADHVTEVLSLAFYNDPVWAWAFPDPAHRIEHYRSWWGLFVQTALPRGSIWMTEDGGAAALWVPPGEPELSEEAEARVEPMLRELLGAHADAVLVLLERFDACHPNHAPHHYLSLLGTHPDHRGQGKGMALPRENLERIDEGALPAYLESTNPVNHRRYEGVGFVAVDEFSAPDGGPSVACMWRDLQQ